MRRVALLAVVVAVAGGFAGVAGADGGPMADAGLDQTVTVETTVQLDGTGSTYASGSVAAHEWTIRTPDGRKIAPACPSCERTRFTPRAPGRYEVTLTVTGEDGREANDTLYVYVEDAGPEVELGGPRAPAPDAPATYRASAESEDAELAEVAWAVEDEIVAVRRLDGTTDESELTLALGATETYRVQVVVRDANGRTAYDQLTVRPRDGGAAGSPGWPDSDVDSSTPARSPDCGDPDYRASHLMDCIGIGPSRGPSGDGRVTSSPRREYIRYRTDGYESDLFAGMGIRDSTNAGGLSRRQTGLDGGEYAPWNRGLLERSYEESVGRAARLLFGQERQTITCEMTAGEAVSSRCAEKAKELEREGGTTNVDSDGSGLYAEYGLTNAERVSGAAPTGLEEGRTAEVTIVVREEKEGLVDRAGRTVDTSAEWVQSATAGVFEGGGESTPTTAGSGSTGGGTSAPTASGVSGTIGPGANDDSDYSPPETIYSSTVTSRTGLPRNPGEEP
jgi:hypothetical protein